MGRGAAWAAQDVAQLRRWLKEGRKPREMRAMRPDWSLESIKTKIKQQCRGAPDQPRPLKRRRTTQVLAENETAVTETPRQRALPTQLTGRVALDVLACPTRRSPSVVLQARPCTEIDG